MIKPGSSQGFIFLMVVIFIQVYSILSLLSLENGLVAEKMNVEAEARQHLLNEGQLIIGKIEAELTQELPSCFIKRETSAQLKEEPLAWWSQHACLSKGRQADYYYVLELLDEAESRSYYRISLLLVDLISASSKLLLQRDVLIKVRAPQTASLTRQSSLEL